MDNASPALRLTILETQKLQALRAQKREYEVQREAWELHLETLDNKIIETQAKYGAIYNRNAPLLSLPNEIVAQIFWFSITVIQDDTEDEYTLTEIVVSQVCKKWREIALSLPAIWSTFYYDASEFPNPKVTLARLSAYLSRSKQHLLELWLGLDPGISRRDKDYDDGCIQLVKAILPHAERWHRVTIWVDTKTNICHKPFQQINAPHLIHFSLRLRTQDHYPFGDSFLSLEPVILRGGAPNLTSVFLDGRGFETFLPPLANVTTLRVEENTTPFEASISETAFFEILALPALENLSIIGDVFELDAVDVFWPPTVLMANLRHLRFSHSVLLMYALTLLKAPLLETLELKNTEGHVIENLSGIATATPFPSLRSLATHESMFSDGSGALMCKITAGITNLLVSQEEFDTSILFYAINSNIVPEFPWPNLKVVSLNVESMQEIAVCLSFVDRYPGEQPLTIRVPETGVDDWETRTPQDYSTLARKCNIERLNDDNPIQPKPCWPPGYDPFGICTDDDDHFVIQEYHL